MDRYPAFALFSSLRLQARDGFPLTYLPALLSSGLGLLIGIALISPYKNSYAGHRSVPTVARSAILIGRRTSSKLSGIL